MLPSSAELARLRDDLEDRVLPDTANILTVTRTPDGQGGFSEAWGTAYTGVACRVSSFIQNAGHEAQVGGGALQPFSLWQFTFPHGTDLSTEMRVEVGTVTYSIAAVDPGKSLSVCLRARGSKL